MDETATIVNQMCTIRIIFPAISDQQAIGIKSQVEKILSEIPGSQVHFGLIPAPPK